ncbi:MAG: HIRAN domain-containing protein [Prevotella sp.]|nr:HIRAN domain-containing protein [Prevotella sp.]
MVQKDKSDETPEFQRKVILECPVAGIGFHDIKDIWDELYVGAKIALVRERNNKYDKNAVAVALADDYDGNPDEFDFNFILGYIPRQNNHAIAAILDMGWEEFIEAEISELNDHASYSDRLHITVYIRSKKPVKPKDNRIRIKYFNDDEEWNNFTDMLWQKGYSYFRWGGCSPWELELPEKGDKVVFIRKYERESELYLMMVIATGDDCAPFIDDIELLHAVEDSSLYVLTVVKGPVCAMNNGLAFLGKQLVGCQQPDVRLEKAASDALMEIIQYD